MRRTINTHTFSLRVYMEDTDAQARVYYANYLKFCERARTEFLFSLGISHAELMKEGEMFVVHSCFLKCHASAHLSEILEVKTHVTQIKAVQFDVCHLILREEATVATVEVGLAFVNAAGRLLRLPENVRERLVAYQMCDPLRVTP